MTPIRAAINAISAKYQGGERAWLQEKNPMALRQLDALADKVDAAALTGDGVATERACLAWKGNWLFWIQNYRVENRRTA
jgi:hypothetical protein